MSILCSIVCLVVMVAIFLVVWNCNSSQPLPSRVVINRLRDFERNQARIEASIATKSLRRINEPA